MKIFFDVSDIVKPIFPLTQTTPWLNFSEGFLVSFIKELLKETFRNAMKFVIKLFSLMSNLIYRLFCVTGQTRYRVIPWLF